MSNDNTTNPTQHPQPADGEVPFEDDKFTILMGVDADQSGNVRMRMAYTDKALMAGGKHLDLGNPAVFMGWWIKEHWKDISNMAATEFNVRQSLAMVSAGNESTLHLVSPDGSRLQ